MTKFLDRNVTIIIISMAVALFLGVAVFRYILPALIILPPAQLPPLSPNGTHLDLFKQLNKQQQALEKNLTRYPCSGGGSFNPRPGVLCPEDNNNTRLFHPNPNNTI
jgi:hypothetical protein